MMTENSTSEPKQHTVLKSWGLVLVVLTLVPLAYGFFYFQDRSSYLTNHYFRSLSGIEKQINHGLKGMDYLLGFAVVEDNSSLKPLFKERFCQDNSNPNYCREYRAYLKKYSSSFHNIKFAKKAISCVASSTSDSVSVINKKNDKTCFLIKGSFDNKKITVFDEKKSSQDTNNEVLTVTVPIKDLIDPLQALNYFNRILLLNQAGNIIYRSGSDDLAKVRNISAFDDFVRFENLNDYLNSGIETKLELQGKNISYKDVAQVTSHSRIRKATIAGIKYLLYIQPFHAARQQMYEQANNKNNKADGAIAIKGNPDNLAYIVGVIPTENNNKAIMSLPLGRINILFFAILIILLLTPHLKLFFSGPLFMPSRTFTVLLVVSFPLLTIVLVLGALSAFDYFQLKQSLDKTAKEISRSISANFHEEFDQLNKVLRSKPNHEHEISSDVKPEETCLNDLKLPMFSYDKCEDLKEIMLIQPDQEKPKKYPIFELAFYLDSVGKQTGRQITYRSFPAIGVKVHRRMYFKQSYYHPEGISKWPGDLSIWPGGISIRPENLKYYSERIETYDHGIKLTALSFPVSSSLSSDCDKECKKIKHNEPKVLAIIKLMHSFFQPVMPASFGFAVIKDSSGEVLYHSNDQRSLLENFYIETDENQQIIAAAKMRRKHLVSGNYNGRAHNFWITPLEHTPWSLVVFYDTELMELANIKSSIFSLGFSFLLIILLLLIFLAFCYCWPEQLLEKFSTIVPNRTKWLDLKEKSDISSSVFNKVFTLSYTCLLILIFGLIAYVSFACSIDSQVKEMAKFNLLHIGSNLLERQVALTTEISRVTEINDNELEKTTYLDKNLFDFANYAHTGSDQKKHIEPYQPSYWLATNIWNPSEIEWNKINCNSNIDDHSENSVFPELTEYMPIISRMDNRHHLLSNSNASDESWCFNERFGENLTVVFNDNSKSEFQLTSTGYYTNTQSTRISFWWYFYIFPVVPLVIYCLVKLTLFRLLGLGFQDHEDLQDYILRQAPEYNILNADEKNEKERANSNFLKITSGESENFIELRSILFNLSHNHMINYSNTIPVMQLKESGILQQNNGMIAFSYPEMKKWVSHQPWDKSIKDFQVQDTTNLWSIMAMPFYSIIILAFVFLVLSGGQVGELMLALIPIVLTGGIPFISSFIGKRFGLD